MAIQTLRLGVVLAVGFSLAAATLPAAALDTLPTIEPGLRLEDPPAAEQWVQRGRGALLPCNARSPPGHSHLTFWTLNDTLLSSSDPRFIRHRNGSLQIIKVAGKKIIGSEGIYRCLVSSADGALLSKEVLVKVAYMKDFTLSPGNMSAIESQPIVLPCSINSAPMAQVVWLKDNLPLPQNASYVPLPTGSLLITSAHSSDTGFYRCKVTNNILKKTKLSPEALLTVAGIDDKAPAVVSKPRILPLDLSLNVTVLVGDDVALYCVVEGRPRPVIQWLNDMKVVVGNSEILVLKNVSLQNSGNYTCSAYNSGGRITQVHTVTVHQVPYFNATPVSKVYPPSLTIRLECQALGTPRPKISWYKNGKPFFTNGTFERASVLPSGMLRIGYSLASDAGIYQCIAQNSAGTSWTSATVKMNYSSNSPTAPLEVHCQTFNDTSVCLNWSSVPGVQAYTVLAHHPVPGIRPRDYVTNETFKMADNLDPNVNYTFSIRTYSKEASNEFAHVTCQTKTSTWRNLTIEVQGSDSILLGWSQLNTDSSPCQPSSGPLYYKVSWRKVNQSSVNVQHVNGLTTYILGLKPSIKYKVRVQLNPGDLTEWTEFVIPKSNLTDQTDFGENHIDSNYVNVTSPTALDASSVTPRSVNLTWTAVSPMNGNDDVTFFVCYIVTSEGKTCEKNGKVVKSSTNYLVIRNLRPRTEYEFKVQSHDKSSGMSSDFSHSLLFTTQSDVPSTVQNVKYKILNSTAICIKWDVPVESNGILKGYSIKYTPNDSWLLEDWYSVEINLPQKEKGCWNENVNRKPSIVLKNLDAEKQYLLVVMALNEMGAGNPTGPITFGTKGGRHKERNEEEKFDAANSNSSVSTDDTFYKQGIGIVLGLSISLIVMGSSVLCFFLWSRYFKKRGVRNRSPRDVGPKRGTFGYANGQDRCAGDSHEMQQLVEGNGTVMYLPTHVDTKGGSEFPNKQLNGTAVAWSNGNVPNHVHITENPQYCNAKPDDTPQLNVAPAAQNDSSYEEDSNSNLHRVKPVKNADVNSSTDSNLDLDASFNHTKSTIVEELTPTKLPALGPNG